MDVTVKVTPSFFTFCGMTKDLLFFDFTPATAASPFFPLIFVTLYFIFPATKESPFLSRFSMRLSETPISFGFGDAVADGTNVVCGGCLDGSELDVGFGVSVGDEVSSGESVGLSVGDEVSPGKNVGCSVGFWVGFAVGDGCDVGVIPGCSVGDMSGIFVGLGVAGTEVGRDDADGTGVADSFG